MATNKTFYQQLKPVVLEYVEAFREDFTKHDRAFFRKNPNTPFLIAIRPTGTDICNMDEGVWYEDNDTVREKSRETCITWMTTYNQRFLYGHCTVDGQRRIIEISKDDAISRLQNIAPFDDCVLCFLCHKKVIYPDGVFNRRGHIMHKQCGIRRRRELREEPGARGPAESFPRYYYK